MRSLLLSLLLYVTAFAIQLEWERYESQLVFEQKLDRAFEILKTSKALNLHSANFKEKLFSRQIPIHGLSEEELLSLGRANAGGIVPMGEGKYEILLNKELNPETLAHTLAHEVFHIGDEQESSKFLKQYPTLDRNINLVSLDLFYGVQNQNRALQKETLFVLYSLFCSELRAYRVNNSLEMDGLLPIHPDLKRQGLPAFVAKKYIQRYHLALSSREKTSLTRACQLSASFSDYQRILVSVLFPGLKPKDHRNPSSLALQAQLLGFDKKALREK